MRILLSTLFFLFVFLGTIKANEITITEDWKIYVGPNAHQAVIRAAKDLQSFIGDHHGLELEIAEAGNGQGIYLTVNEKMKKDGFSLKVVASKQQVFIEAPSARAIYQGVLVLEDFFNEKPAISESLNENVTYPFKDRFLVWDVNLTGQNKMANGFSLEKHFREAVRLGYSGVECNRFLGMELIQQDNPKDSYPWYTYWGPSMDQFVSSPLFDGVFPEEYLENNLSDLKHVVQVAKSFGLKPIFMGYEPRYVPEEFLQKHPELRGPRVDHPLRSITPRYTLCTDREEVREHYRALAQKLAEEVPDIAEMHMIFHDSGAGLCWYNALYRGKNGPEHCKDIPMEERMSKFFGAIQQGFKDGGLDIPIVAQPHKGNFSDIDALLTSAPEGISTTAGNWASWSLTWKDPLGIDLHVLKKSRETGRRTLYFQQHFTGFDVAPTTEYPVPYFLASRLKRALKLDLDVLTTLGGISSPPIKKQSAMQEIYRQFLLNPETPEEDLVNNVAARFGGKEGGPVLVEAWKNIDAAIRENGRTLGFGMGLEYASRRTLVRPLVPDQAALLPYEREWWLRYTFSGYQRFGHAHMFRGEGGYPSLEWYPKKLEQSARARDAFQKSSRQLQDFINENRELAREYPYLVNHERQLRLLGHIYATGAFLYEGQALLDIYNDKNIWEGAKQTVDADVLRYEALVKKEIDNTRELIKFLNEEGDIGMVLLPEEMGVQRLPAHIVREKN